MLEMVVGEKILIKENNALHFEVDIKQKEHSSKQNIEGTSTNQKSLALLMARSRLYNAG